VLLLILNANEGESKMHYFHYEVRQKLRDIPDEQQQVCLK
jgi:hypothetical protein